MKYTLAHIPQGTAGPRAKGISPQSADPRLVEQRIRKAERFSGRILGGAPNPSASPKQP